LVDEMAADLTRYAEEVSGFRKAASGIIKRTYLEKMKAIREKYEPMISFNEKEEKQRRMDAIAVLEGFLRKYPSDKKWTPDVMFRLAELFYEKSSDEFLTAQEDYQKALDSPNPPTTPSPKADYTQTVSLYRRLLVDFPNYRLLDATYYLLGFCLGEMGQDPEARQALLALVCANQYKPLDPPAKQALATGLSKGPVTTTTRTARPSRRTRSSCPRRGRASVKCTSTRPSWPTPFRPTVACCSSRIPRTTTRPSTSWRGRTTATTASSTPSASSTAWSSGPTARKPRATSSAPTCGPKRCSTWASASPNPTGTATPCPIRKPACSARKAFYRGREGETHVKEVFQRLGDIYFDSTKYGEAIAVYKYILQMWPFFADAPKLQEKIVKAYERDRNLMAASKEREMLGRNYSKGSEWYRQNTNNPEALAAAAQLAEDALLTAATNVHAAAQACRSKSQETPTDLKKREECQQTYRTAAELYEKYLGAYPNSKRAYEFSAFYADALYYGGKVQESIPAYIVVRDSNVDNKYQKDAALQVIKAFEEIIDRLKLERRIEDPPIPDEKNTKPPVTALPMHEVYRNYMQALDWYVANLPDERVPDLRYASAVLLLKHRDWPEARSRLAEISDAYCASKPEIGFKAYDAVLTTYFIDFNIDDEEAKDCALGRLLQVVDKFGDSACSKSPLAKPYLARIQDIKASVKTTVIKKRLDIALENEEKGTDKQLVQCRESAGGIAVVTGTATGPGRYGRWQARRGGTQPRSKTGTDLDEGLALDLMDLIAANPKDQDAPSNLNNACVIYEKMFKYGEATKCYERLARDYPETPLAKDAVWNSARNQYRFFEFEKAVGGYLKVATDPKFAKYEHRKEALGIAAQLLDNDQQYARAADLYKKYADNIADKPADSAQAYAFACTAYEKSLDTAKQVACLHELIKRYGKQPPAGEYVVKSYLQLATLAEQGRDKKAVLAAYKQVRDEFVARRLAGRDARRRRRRQGRLPDPRRQVQGLPGQDAALHQRPQAGAQDLRRVHQRGQGAAGRVRQDLGVQGRQLDLGLVPPSRRHFLRVRAEAGQGRRQSARGGQEAVQEGVQGRSQPVRRGRNRIQGRHLPVRHACRGRGQAAVEGDPGPRGRSRRDQRLRQEGEGEPVEVPARRVPLHQG
jgi:tetratricopeptide (TPR) repeat protein